MDARIRKIAVFVAVAAVAFVAAVAILRYVGDGVPTASEGDSGRGPAATVSGKGEIRAVDEEKTGGADPEVADSEPDGDGEKQEDKTPEELQQEEEEKKVEAFDSLTDKWMEKSGGEVTMKDMDDFVSAFKAVPKARKDECLHRALNLVSDDHVLLLAGILFDKSIDKEYLELVFNDVLNRDEEVKKLILPKIFKDKEHPCWADTAWILDVTGELPKKEKSE
ncbi:MAG: hypothetical protein IKU71_06440 [Kiritimatiellae bacterium]|nr:hypothetical protein [Kiritimatiellia bacterium]